MLETIHRILRVPRNYQELKRQNKSLLQQNLLLRKEKRRIGAGRYLERLLEGKAFESDFRFDLELDPNLLPPEDNQMLAGGSEFLETGLEFVTYLRALCGLEPHHSVLDIGCGSGRMAIPLVQYLTTGKYEGFDPMEGAIEWCEKNISSKYPNFKFQKVNLANKAYRPGGDSSAANFKFPYPNASFDVTFLSSVFTHLLIEEVRNYVEEISRVLKPGGRCLSTFFILNETSKSLVQEKKSRFNFLESDKLFRVIDPNCPESAISYEEDFIRDLFQKNGLRILEPIHFGNWCDRPIDSVLSSQDIIISEKT